MKTAGLAVLALFGGSLVPGAVAGAHGAGATLALKGTIKGVGIRRMSNPDTGALYRWSGNGSILPLGTVVGKGSNRGVGFVRAGNPTGTMTLTGAHGSITLTVTYDQTASFAPLPAHGTYTITGGTGRYAGVRGSGSITRHQGACAGGSSTGQCPAGATYRVTYQFAASTTARI
jgi:hypothetical protein